MKSNGSHLGDTLQRVACVLATSPAFSRSQKDHRRICILDIQPAPSNLSIYRQDTRELSHLRVSPLHPSQFQTGIQSDSSIRTLLPLNQATGIRDFASLNSLVLICAAFRNVAERE